MTVAALPSVVTYVENGVSTVFAAPFRFKSPAHLRVSRIVGGVETVLTLGQHYTVSGGATDAGGTVTRMTATSGGKLRIRRRTPRSQPMVYTTGDRFPAKSHEGAIDATVLMTQENADDIIDIDDRAITAPPGERAGDLPPAAQRAFKFLAFDALGGARVASKAELGAVNLSDFDGGLYGVEGSGDIFDGEFYGLA